MKIFCEYCGVQIDINKENKCPNCGASFEHNVSYKRIHEHKKKQQELDMQEKELNIQGRRIAQQNTSKALGFFSKIFAVAFIVPAIVIIVIIIITIISVAGAIDRQKNKVDDDIKNGSVEFVEKASTVGLNEYGVTSKYRVMVDSYEVIDTHFKPQDGYQFVTFHFVIENLTDSRLFLYDMIDCVVGGVVQESTWDNDRNEIPSSVPKGLKVEGYQAFEVPIDATSYDIKYGDYVTIHIEK